MRTLALVFAVFSGTVFSQSPDWLLVSESGRAQAGAAFELILAAPQGAELPDQIALRVRAGGGEIDLKMEAAAPAERGRRRYRGTLPGSAAGAVAVRVAAPPSNAVILMVDRRDAMQSLTSAVESGQEPPLSENEAMYFVVGSRERWSARFQLSFKYRLFDTDSGFGRDRHWLSGLHFAYTQTSLWDLEGESAPFFDTSYRPSLFWRWPLADRQTIVDGVRLGIEHESNGQSGIESRSINIAFFQPEWRWKTTSLGSYEFTPKAYYYIEKEDNPDIQQYRGYVDWRARWDSGDNWVVTALARVGTAQKGSLQIDVARRARDLKIGPVSGYLYAQYFNGYGESLRSYNLRFPWQLRLGLAIIP